MSRRGAWNSVLICLLLLVSLLITPKQARADGEDFVPGQAIIRLREGASLDEIMARYGGTVAGRSRDGKAFLLQFGGDADLEKALQRMKGDRNVERAERNYKLWTPEAQLFSLSFSGQYALPNPDPSPAPDLRYQNQWATVKLGLAQALERTQGQGIVVAIIDTGIDRTHPVLVNRVLAGHDFVDNDADPTEQGSGRAAGHGTFLGGIVALVAPKAWILPVRVLNSDGTGTLFGVAEGIRYAVDHGARIVNLSLGAPHDTGTLKDAVSYAVSRGALVVASVGNRSPDDHGGALLYPARYRTAVAVAATDSDDRKATFSNWGKETDLSAPGVAIYSTYLNGSYGWWSGTSMSTAFVSAAAALIWAQHPEWKADQVTVRLARTAVNIDRLNLPQYWGKLGAGRIDLDAATR